LTSSSGTGTLTGSANASNWSLSGAGGTYVDTTGTAPSGTVAFSGFQTLQGGSGGNAFNINANSSLILIGGSGPDNFVFTNGAVLTGSLNGGGGSDTLDLS